MYKKILSFIVNENNKLLLLRNNPEDPKHGGDIWYTEQVDLMITKQMEKKL